MDALFWTAGIIGLILLAMQALPHWLKKSAVVRVAPQPASDIVTDIPAGPSNSPDDDRRHTFDRLLLLQSLLEEFKVPLEQQQTVLQPLVMKMLPATSIPKESIYKDLTAPR